MSLMPEISSEFRARPSDSSMPTSIVAGWVCTPKSQPVSTLLTADNLYFTVGSSKQINHHCAQDLLVKLCGRKRVKAMYQRLPFKYLVLSSPAIPVAAEQAKTGKRNLFANA